MSVISIWNPTVFLIWLMIAGLALVFILATRRGFTTTVRRIEALDAVDDMIGRATEMGGTIMMGTGGARLSSAGATETMMAFAMVRYVVERTAKLGTRIIVSTVSSDHIPIIEDTIMQASLVAGNPDYYQGGGEMARLIGAEGFSYVTATLHYLDEKSGENVKALIGLGSSGGYGASGPTVGMAANIKGVVSLSGTSSVHQMHNFVACFDYAVIGDEIYALSAYLTRDPKELGTIIGLDVAKLIIIGMIVLGTIYAAVTGGGILFQ